MGMLGWQEYAISDGGAITRKVTKTDLPLSLSLGVLGLNGVTAYFALLELEQRRPCDTVVLSTATGAVGSAVGQIAKLAGCRTVGIAGGDAKTRICREDFGYDDAIDYKGVEALNSTIAAACPDGIDVYFDKTAGPISDAVQARLAVGARGDLRHRLGRQLEPAAGRTEGRAPTPGQKCSNAGVLVFDYRHRYEEAVARLASWVRAGSLRYREGILDGIEQAPGAISGL